MVDERTARISELERGFRRAGLPNLIQDYSATEDVFTRAIPFLSLVFVAEMTNALDVEARWWQNLLFFVGGVVVMVGAFGMLNLTRGRPFASIPRKVGVPELAAFVVVPAIPPLVFNGQWRFALGTLAANLALLGLVYGWIGFGLLAIVRWAAGRLISQLRVSLTLLVRAVPLLLFFSLVSFLATETWQVFSLPAPARFWAAIGLFVALGIAFLTIQIPTSLRELEQEAGAERLRPRERANLGIVVFVAEGLQVLVVAAAVWLLFVTLGGLVVTTEIRQLWLGGTGHQAFAVPFPGDDVAITWELLRTSTGVAAFAGLYYAVAMLVDATYRDLFIDELTEQLRDTFANRAEYLRLRRAT